MKSSTIIFSFLFTFLLVFSSCQHDDGSFRDGEQQENIPDTFSQYFGNEISRDFLGTVVNKNNLPLQGVTITIGNETAQTDSNGVFIIKDAEVNERFGYIKAEKAGYIHGSRSVVPSEGTNKVEIMLLEATPIATISSGTAETVSLSNGSSVSFDGNFIKEDGSNYEGSVNVIMHHLDPVDEDMPMQMPGMLYAENEDGAERMLQTLVMLAVELRGSGGEELNLAEGSTSEIKVPVDASLMGIAPATIPLWYFDEANGYWKEEGEATLQGNMYVGMVSHFSFWNCDIPIEAITLCVNTTNEDNIPLANLEIAITSATYGTTYGYSNENGEVCGFVPSNESLELSVYSYELCGNNSLSTQTVGPFTEDLNISVVVSNDTGVILETVTGTFNTCDGEPITNGYVQLTYDNQITFGSETITTLISDGNFEISILRCEANNSFKLNGRDYSNNQRTGSINYTFTSPLTNIGVLQACNSATEYIEFNLDGVDWFSPDNTENITTYYNPENHYLQITGYVINGNGSGGSFVFYGTLNSSSYTGTYDTYNSDIPNDTGFYLDYMNMSTDNNSIIYNITSFGEVGEYIDVNFSGDYYNFNGNLRTISGVVHVLRDE